MPNQKKSLQIKNEIIKSQLEKIFPTISQDNLMHIIEFSEGPVEVPRKTRLETPNILLIISGAIIAKSNFHGEMMIDFMAHKGECIFDMYEYLGLDTENSYLETIRKTTYISIEYENFIRVIQSDFHLYEKWHNNLKSNLKEFINRGHNLKLEAADKINLLYSEKPTWFEEIPRKYLAQYLGVRPETFSRKS